MAAGQSFGSAEQEAATEPEEGEVEEISPELAASRIWHEAFWGAFLKDLRLDDRSQPVPNKPARSTNQYLPMPPFGQGQCWMSVSLKGGTAGVFVTWLKDYASARETYEALLAAREHIEREVGLPMTWTASPDGKYTIEVRRGSGNLKNPVQREQALAFLTDATNRMVNALRGRIEAVLAEQKPVN